MYFILSFSDLTFNISFSIIAFAPFNESIFFVATVSGIVIYTYSFFPFIVKKTIAMVAMKTTDNITYPLYFFIFSNLKFLYN